MKTYYHFVALVMCLSLGLSEQAEPERLCGRNLADALDLVCYDRGFHWEVSKRSGISRLSTKRRRRTNTLYGKRNYQGNRRGVVEECCYIGCNYATLESYCAQPGDDQMQPMNRFRFMIGRTTVRPSVPQHTPRPPVVTTPANIFPSAVFNSNLRPGSVGRKSYFYVHLGTRPTRSPLI